MYVLGLAKLSQAIHGRKCKRTAVHQVNPELVQPCACEQAQSTSPVVAPAPQGRTHFLGRGFGRSTSAGSSGQALEQATADALAATSASPSTSNGGVFSMAMGVWKKATSKLFDLEAKIANQVRAGERFSSAECHSASLIAHRIAHITVW